MIRLFFFFGLIIFNSCTWNEIPEVICVPDEQVYLELVQPIIESNCISCHYSTDANPAVLVTYNGVIDAINNHSLREEVVSLRMPMEGYTPLSFSEINIIKNWIDCE
jgi:hypothetical protein